MTITPEELRIALDRPVFGSAFVKAVAGGIALLDAIRRKMDRPSWSAKLHLRFQGIRARRAANAALRAYGTSIGRSLGTSEQATLRKIIADEACRQMQRRMVKEAVEEVDRDAFYLELLRHFPLAINNRAKMVSKQNGLGGATSDQITTVGSQGVITRFSRAGFVYVLINP
ncbi:MAG: hypothetical protein ABSD08_11290 [Xanthobacteraceae bacterium]|jgi:hypothetical protein